jgi:hypothetical protein
MLGIAQLFAKTDDVTREQLLHSRVDVLVLVTNNAHQLPNDLRIRFAIESVIGWAGFSEDLDQRAMNCTTPRAIRPQERAVDVE